jgi:MFS family permease
MLVSSVDPRRASSRKIIAGLLPLVAVVFVLFLLTGIALPVLPFYVTRELGGSTLVVGWISSTQFAASLVSRLCSGRYVDRRGAKGAVLIGLTSAAAAGLFCLVSVAFRPILSLSVGALLLGRAALGVAESFVTTGVLAWSLAIVDARAAGRVMSYVGTAMYAALALGAPIGNMLYSAFGFPAVGLVTCLVSVVAWRRASQLRGIEPRHHEAEKVTKVIRAVWIPGLGLACSSFGFAAMTAFVGLLFSERGWQPVWLPFTAFSAAFMTARVFLGHLPDTLGGAGVAIVCVLVEGSSLSLVGFANGPTVAVLGAALTGLGYSLVYPGLGVEAVARTPPGSRGSVMGGYTAFLDLALGIAGPMLGVVGNHAGLNVVFFVSAIFVSLALIPSATFVVRPRN